MRYQLNQDGFKAIGKVVGWSIASAVVASLIIVMEQVEIPVQWTFLVPVINVVLYTVKEFVSDKR